MALSPINGAASAPISPLTAASAARVDATPALGGTEHAGLDDAVSVDTFPSAPPPEVLAAISGALAAGDGLAAAGQRVSFSTQPDQRLAMHLIDDGAGTATPLRGSDVLALAEGRTPASPAH